jgi:peptide deformylase
MAVRDLHLLGSPVLRQQSAKVSAVDAEVRRFIDDLFETMDAAKGVGLAANQVGVATRVAVVGVEHERFVMINPVIVSVEGRDRAEEGCLSIPEVYGEVTRPDRIVLEALDRDGQPYRKEAAGLLARAIQHEIDHLDGILFIDHLGALKRQLLVARWKKEHRGEGVIKTIRPEHARPE